MSNTPQLTIRRQCIGRCGTLIAYTLATGSFAPAMSCEGLAAYKDGHLCTGCESILEEAIATRRTAIAAAEFTQQGER